jgi:homoserine kinase
MTAFDFISVKVPATTANLGPGFDCLGAALTLSNQFQFSLIEKDLAQGSLPQLEIQVSGVEADRVKTDASNLVYHAFSSFYRHLDQSPPPVRIQIQLGVPLARGLGSSATAIVGGLVGANQLAGSPLTSAQLLKLAIDLEGHPDNVAPALLGGCRLAASHPGGDWRICDIPWSEDVIPVLAVPDFELSTQAARQVLPETCDYADAIFNMAHLGLLVRGLETGCVEWLQTALQDRLHQPFRRSLIQGYEAVQAAALAAGAHGLVISGAGPTLLALAAPQQATAVATALQRTWAEQGVRATVSVLAIDGQGTVVA